MQSEDAALADQIREAFAEMQHVGIRNGADQRLVQAVHAISHIAEASLAITIAQGPFLYAFDFGDRYPDSMEEYAQVTSAGQYLDPADDEPRTKAEYCDIYGVESDLSVKISDETVKEQALADLDDDQEFLLRLVEVSENGFGLLVNGQVYTEPEYLIQKCLEGRGATYVAPHTSSSDLTDLGTISESVVRQI